MATFPSGRGIRSRRGVDPAGLVDLAPPWSEVALPENIERDIGLEAKAFHKPPPQAPIHIVGC